MSPVTHLLAGWLLATAAPLNGREKAAVVLAGVIPDIDGLGVVSELLTRNSSHPLLWFSEYHHTLHTLAFSLLVTSAACFISRRTARSAACNDSFLSNRSSISPRAQGLTAALLAFVSFHLHLVCDLIGSRGPDGYSWPIPYLAPFSHSLQLTWHGQWVLNGWQNIVITCMLLLATFVAAFQCGSSPLELVSPRANQALVSTLRRRFHFKGSGPERDADSRFN